jgi:hypothetical protein
LPSATAPIAAGPSLPTIMVSTTPIAIQPSSLSTTGTASFTIAPKQGPHRDLRQRSPAISRGSSSSYSLAERIVALLLMLIDEGIAFLPFQFHAQASGGV